MEVEAGEVNIPEYFAKYDLNIEEDIFSFRKESRRKNLRNIPE